ncbi:hypothetical protein ABT023_17950 [Micromonospora sp. NPDC002296]
MLAQLDITAGLTPVRRAPARRCLAEPEQVVAELTDELRRLAGTDARAR